MAAIASAGRHGACFKERRPDQAEAGFGCSRSGRVVSPNGPCGLPPSVTESGKVLEVSPVLPTLDLPGRCPASTRARFPLPPPPTTPFPPPPAPPFPPRRPFFFSPPAS